MMLASISGKDGNQYYPGTHGLVRGHIVAPAPATVKIGIVSTDDQKLQVNWTWESSALESMKSEVASAKPVELPLEMNGSWAGKQAVAKELRVTLLVRDEASEWKSSWGPRTDVVACVVHNDGVDPFASGIEIKLPPPEELSAAATEGHKVKLKNGKVFVKVRITSISQFGLVGRSLDSTPIAIQVEPSSAGSSCIVS